MPRIKRWAPIAHFINRDPEFRRLRQETADWMGYVWLEMLFIADQNEGEIKGKVETIADSLSYISLRKRPSLSSKCIVNALHLMEEFGWIVIETNRVLVTKYAEYHKTRDAIKSHEGVEK